MNGVTLHPEWLEIDHCTKHFHNKWSSSGSRPLSCGYHTLRIEIESCSDCFFL